MRLKQTGVAPVFRKALQRPIQRLLDFQGIHTHPRCPPLVLVGEYDHFIQPREHAHFTAACTQARCALIHNADHLAQLEQRDACANQYSSFLRGKALPSRSPGSCLLTRQQLLQLEKPQATPATESAPGAPAACRGQRMDRGDQRTGFLRRTVAGHLPDIRGARGWLLECKDLPAQPVLPLRQNQNGLTFVFPHSGQQASQALATQFQLQSLPTAACA